MEHIGEQAKPAREQAWLRREVKRFEPLRFHADHGGEADLKVHTIQLFPEPELDAVTISLVTRLGTLSLLLSPGLAQQLANGLSGLLQPRVASRRDAKKSRPR